MKKRTKCVIGILVGIGVLAALLPLPQTVRRQYTAVDTFSGESAELAVDLTYLRFLLWQDRMVGEIRVTAQGGTRTYPTEYLRYQGQWPANHADTVHAFSGWYRNNTEIMAEDGNGMMGSQIVGPEAAYAYISTDFRKIVLYHQQSKKLEHARTWQYVGSDGQESLEEAQRYFEGYLHNPEGNGA